MIEEIVRKYITRNRISFIFTNENLGLVKQYAEEDGYDLSDYSNTNFAYDVLQVIAEQYKLSMNSNGIYRAWTQVEVTIEAIALGYFIEKTKLTELNKVSIKNFFSKELNKHYSVFSCALFRKEEAVKFENALADFNTAKRINNVRYVVTKELYDKPKLTEKMIDHYDSVKHNLIEDGYKELSIDWLNRIAIFEHTASKDKVKVNLDTGQASFID
jgi:hypothetical protein